MWYKTPPDLYRVEHFWVILIFLNMDKISICHSFKDIPIPSKKEYLIKLLEKTENLIGRMRWKAFFYLQPKDPTKKINTKNNYGFKTQKSPPFNKLLQNFEYDLLCMIK